ncbi:MAG: GNVR domain-containing protein, partial [Sulfurimonadaceae bacterium]
IKRTELVGEVELLDRPIKPKKKLIVVVAFITGLMLSVFLAFFLEFIQGNREEEEEKEAPQDSLS